MPQLIVKNRLHVLAHAGLQALLSTPDTPLSLLLAGLDRVDFVDDARLAAPGEPQLPVLLPVSSELQADRLRALRTRHAMALLVAVTDDVSGHLTHDAIRAGASSVFNLAITEERQTDLLLAQLRAHRAPGAPSTPVRLCYLPDGPVHRPAAAAPGPALPASPRIPPRPQPGGGAGYDAELLRMLCSPATVSEIARRNYCSERSMYRRIRRLYDTFGVSGRSELHARAAELGLIGEDGPRERIRRAG
ncbi:DNA-binding response regulator [Streptomyces sp. NPDC012466]|uniref:DNA-binding response regulator n=1 Tax=Streptomyces sp. NPDC012466 TaxID=3364835 RepID=UPI0036F0FE33